MTGLEKKKKQLKKKVLQIANLEWLNYDQPLEGLKKLQNELLEDLNRMEEGNTYVVPEELKSKIENLVFTYPGDYFFFIEEGMIQICQLIDKIS